MYSRSYYPDERSELRIPEGYDGTALTSAEQPPETEIRSTPKISAIPKAEVKISPADTAPKETEESAPASVDLGEERGAFGNLFSGSLSTLGRFLPKGFRLHGIFDDLGIEELLIIGIALFLFFSHSGDKELALMLAFLIFIK